VLIKAVELAKANPVQGLPKMAALIYDKKRVVSYGLNQKKTHPLQARFTKHPEALCIHAEIAALANARQSVEGMVMYVARVNRRGEPRLAKPCKGCASAIIEFGLGNVEWTE
jgi:pyrimidine deaminase RibD-like protein